jgi:hypothetical protein
MNTTYGKRSARAARSHQRSANFGNSASGVLKLTGGIGAVAGAYAGVVPAVILGAALYGTGHMAGKVGEEQAAKASKKRAMGFAINHLVNHARRNGSGKQAAANSHDVGLVKGHYATDRKTGKSYFVKEHRRGLA